MKKLVLTFALLSLAACNNSSPGSSSKTAPAAKPAAGGVNTGAPASSGSDAELPPPPPPSSKTASATTRPSPNDDQIVGGTVVPSEPATKPALAKGQPAVTSTSSGTGKPLPPAQQECAVYKETRPEWAPGLPDAPAADPVFTDTASDASTRYTDARQDKLFAVARDRAESLPKEMQKRNQEFAQLIRDVRVSIDMAQTREVKVRVTYLHRMQKETIDLRGVMEKPLNVPLAQVPAPGAPKDAENFAGVLTCTDADHGCKNILLRVDLKSKTGKIARTAYIVHRWGEAHITQSEQERRQFARIPNQNQSAFAEYVSNSLNNQCLNTLGEIKAGRRQIPLCAQKNLEAQCGGEDAKKPAAKAFGLRSWAVAKGGRSGFELVMSAKDYDGVADLDQKRSPYLIVRGPLAWSKTQPVFQHPLVTTGSVKGLSEVYLMNNDGGGNLVLRFDFGSTPDTKSRLSVSSLLPNTAYSQSVVEAAQSSPVVPQDAIEQQDLVSAE